MLNKKSFNNWEWKKLGELGECIRGVSYKPIDLKKEYDEKTCILFRANNISNNSLILEDVQFVNLENVKSVQLLKENDILICMSSGSKHLLGKSVQFKHQKTNKMYTIGAFCSIYRVNSRIDSDFIKFVFQSRRYTEHIAKSSSGTNINNLKKWDIEEFTVPVPPLPTQHKIVSILERAEKLKNLRQEANEDTNSIIQALFSEMFGDPIKNEKNYTVKPLVEICHRITDGTHVTPKYTEKGIPFLRVTDLTNSNDSKKFISEEEHKDLIKRCKPEKGDILYSKNGTIGIAKLIDWDYEFSIFVSLCLIKPKKESILPKYLEIFLNTPFALRQALLHSKKGTITNLHLIEIKKILVPLPSLREQEAFLKRVAQINNIQNNQNQSTEEINTLFDALMQKAFSGGLVA